MRPVRARAQGVPLKLVVLLGLFLFATTAAGAVGTLWAMGKIELPFLSRPVDTHPGMVRVPISPALIPAYTKLVREHLLDGKSQWSYHYLPPQEVKPEVILDPHEIIGRVLNHDKHPGYAFTEKDFLEKGTRPGLVAGIPPGRVMMTLDASKIDGFFRLQQGDHVNMTATYQLEMSKGGGGGKLSAGLQAVAQIASMNKQAQTRLLAEDAILVTPVTIREKPTISHSVQQGTMVRKVPVQEVDIAIWPDDVDRINEALVTEVKITVEARSGRPGEEQEAKTEHKSTHSDPLSNYALLDVISGNKREVVVLPKESYQSPAENGTRPRTGGMRHRGSRSFSRNQ